MNQQFLPPWQTLLRYSIGLIALTWIFIHIDWNNLIQVWQSANKTLLLLSALSYAPVPILFALRLQWLLALQNIHISLSRAIRFTFIANFIGSALPFGTAGIDSTKACYVASITPRKHEAITTILFDRLVGVCGLVLLSTLTILADWNNPVFADWKYIISACVIMLAMGSSVYLVPQIRKSLRVEHIITQLPLANHLRRVDQAIRTFHKALPRVLLAIGLTVVLQVVAILSLFLAGWALGMIQDTAYKGLSAYLGYTPLCFLAGVLPIGAMEEMFNQLFVESAHLGNCEAAYSLSLFSRLIALAWALPGGFLLCKNGGRPIEPITDVNLPHVHGENDSTWDRQRGETGPDTLAERSSHP